MSAKMELEKLILVYDVGSTYTKLAVLGWHNGAFSFLGRSQAPTTLENVSDGLQNAKYNLYNELELAEVKEEEILATSSAAGGLRMVAMGYMPRVTTKAAKEVAMNAGARVLEVLSHEDSPDYKIEILREINPDIILLAGGTDGGDEDSLLENAQVIVRSKVNAVVILAGNLQAQPKVEAILKNGHIQSIRVSNIMPTIHELKVKPARQAIHEQFIQQITKAKGLGKIIQIVSNGIVMPTPGAVLLGSELLACGTHKNEGVGDLLVVDIGGATTDVHSILPSLSEMPDEEKGLVVNNEKQVSYRTVEGNLGLRVSATGIVEAVGAEAVLHKVGLSGQDYEQKLLDYTASLEKKPRYIAQTAEKLNFDEGLAITAIEIALKRHAGYLAQEYDPLTGVAPGTPIGRDLRNVKKIIGVGGFFCHSTAEKSVRVLRKALANTGISLLPKNPEIIIDKNYLLYAIGAVGKIYPDEIVKYAKNYFNQEGK